MTNIYDSKVCVLYRSQTKAYTLLYNVCFVLNVAIMLFAAKQITLNALRCSAIKLERLDIFPNPVRVMGKYRDRL